MHQLFIVTSLQLLLPVIRTIFRTEIFNPQEKKSAKIKCLLFRPKPQIFHTSEITGYTVYDVTEYILLSLQNNVWRLIVFAPFLIIIIKSPKQRLETYCFCSVSYYYYFFYYYYYYSSFFPHNMNVSTADLRNYWTEFHGTWWSYRYMFLVDPKVFVVKGVKAIF